MAVKIKQYVLFVIYKKSDSQVGFRGVTGLSSSAGVAAQTGWSVLTSPGCCWSWDASRGTVVVATGFVPRA
jgi:hypothetical protein